MQFIIKYEMKYKEYNVEYLATAKYSSGKLFVANIKT